MSKAPPSGAAARPPGVRSGETHEQYIDRVSHENRSAAVSASQGLSSKQAKQPNPTVETMLESINSDIDKTLDQIEIYKRNRNAKQDRITQQIDALHELYTRLQLIPENDMSIDFRKRITDMKVSIFEHIQKALDSVDTQTIQHLPDAVKPFYSKGANYTAEQLEVFVKASDLLFIYGQHKLVSFKDLLPIKQAEIQGFVTGFIDKFAVDNIPENEKKSFRTEMLTFNTLCCDLLALIIGSDLPVPNPAQQEQTLMCELLAETCIIVITSVRPIGDSVVMIGDAMAMKPFDFAKKGVMGAVALGATSTSFPALSSLAEGAVPAIAGLGRAAVDFSIQNPLFAYGTLYHLFNYINEKLEIRQFHNNPDFVFRRLLTNLRGDIDRDAFNRVFGEAPNPVVGSFEFAGLLSKCARYVAETFCGQVRSAADMVKATVELPHSTLKVCGGMAARATSAVHNLANRMTATARLAGERMFSDCHSVMEELLDTDKYMSLRKTPLVIEFVRRLGLFDNHRELTEEKVAMHEAISVMTTRVVPVALSDTQGAVVQGSPSPDRPDLDADTVSPRALPDYDYGPNDEMLGKYEPRLANPAPLGAGDEVVNGKRFAAEAEAAAKKKSRGGMKTKRHKAAASKKQKSIKNKRQSRRKFRRSFSRKGRK